MDGAPNHDRDDNAVRRKLERDSPSLGLFFRRTRLAAGRRLARDLTSDSNRAESKRALPSLSKIL